MPLANVDRLWLETLTNYLKGRPLSRKFDRRTSKRERISPATVKTLLQHWRQAFDWLDSNADRFGWQAPRKVQRLFEVELNAIRTKGERDRAADGPDHLTLAEIKQLLHAANDRQRMFILLGLFTGQGQTELRWTRRDEFDLATQTFAHRRNKTGQPGRFWLPSELVALLKGYFAEVEPIEEGLAFSTREGRPLVTAKSDAVCQMFDDVRKAAGITRKGVTFYACRRFLGDRAKRAGGSDLQRAALAHAAIGMGEKHYSNFRDFDAVKRVAQTLHEDMKAAGCFCY